MSRMQTFTSVLTKAGPGDMVQVTPNAQGVSAAILVKVDPGSALTFAIEVSGNNPNDPQYNPNTALWVPFPGFSGSATLVGSLAALVQALRLNCTSFTSGKVTMQFVQLIP